MFFALTIPKIISIHAPRTGSDLKWTALKGLITEFQSTLPARGATRQAAAAAYP